MSCFVRICSGVSLLVGLLLVPSAAAQNKALADAIKLFEQQQYQAAQEALLAIDRNALSETERVRLDDLLRKAPEAIKGSEKAAQDLAAGDQAYEAGNWEEAERFYHAAAENPYASAYVQSYAALQCERIAEKEKLAEAAKSATAVERTVITLQASDLQPAPKPPAQVPDAQEADEPPPAPAEISAPRRLTPADELRLRDDLLWQRALAIAEAQSAEARESIANKDFASARKQVATALQSIEAAARYAEPATKYETAKAAMVALQAELDRAEHQYALDSAKAQQEEIKQRLVDRERIYAEAKAEKIRQSFNTVEQLRRERRYGEAAEVLREVLRIDPGNAQARYELTWAEDFESLEEQAGWHRDLNTQSRAALVKAEEALIPWDVDVMYPRNWLELTANRSKTAAVAGQDVQEAELSKKLDEVLPDVRFVESPLEQIVDWLSDYTKINFSVDWTDLEDNQIRRDTQVTVQLTNVPLRVVLRDVLDKVGGETKLDYTVDEGVLRVATKEKLSQNMNASIYDIRDLLAEIPNAWRQSGFNVTQGLGQGTAGGGGGGGGMFSQGQQQQQQQGQQQGQQNQAGYVDPKAQALIDVIQQSIEPESWRDRGAGNGTITPLNEGAQLVIYNTSDTHRQIRGFLKDLRAIQDLQISIESRFLNVTSNFLEQFGVDLDFVFNSGNAGFDPAVGQGTQGTIVDPTTGAIVLIPRDFSRSGVLPALPNYGTQLLQGTTPRQPYANAGLVPPLDGSSNNFTPIGAQQGSLSLVDPGNASTGVPGSFASSTLTPALSISGSFLDNLQVDFLIRATQANRRSSIVQAPRLVIFNGQRSYIRVGRARDYVATLDPRPAEQVGTFRPIIGVADSGVEMNVRGTISADRRYVLLSIDLNQRDEPRLERFETQRASGNSPGAFVQLRDAAFAQLSTSVSVPDGGTVLLGGLKQVGEIELEAGVPVLNKIPVLKRAFTNQTTVKDTRTLLILVKTKIIIQKEAEDEAFPTFTQAGM